VCWNLLYQQTHAFYPQGHERVNYFYIFGATVFIMSSVIITIIVYILSLPLSLSLSLSLSLVRMLLTPHVQTPTASVLFNNDFECESDKLGSAARPTRVFDALCICCCCCCEVVFLVQSLLVLVFIISYFVFFFRSFCCACHNRLCLVDAKPCYLRELEY